MNADLKPRHTSAARVDELERGFRLSIPEGDGSRYRLAQLDDYAQTNRSQFPHRSTLHLGLQARASASSLPGTWGFGLWNDPFGLSLGFGGNPFQLPALPNTVWFFYASAENYLSFSEGPGNGFLAQAFSSPAFPLAGLAKVGATFPFSRKKARFLMGEIVDGDGVRLLTDVTKWHSYKLEWSPSKSAFWVDGTPVLETPVSPRPPLGLVIWIDNQFAAWRPDGTIGFGLLGNPEPAWLEVKDLVLK